jgi:dipeptidyl aminopeptidase/acylaminoacyl peptidase
MGLEMRAQSRVTALAVLVFCAGGALGAQAPLEAYGKLPTLSNIVLSPDGGKIAFLRSDDQGEVVVAEEVGAPKPLSLLDTEQQKVRSLEWADDDHLIIVMSMTTLPKEAEFGSYFTGPPQEYFFAKSLDTKTNAVQPIPGIVGGRRSREHILNAVAGGMQPRTVDGQIDVYVPGYYFPNGQGRLALFREDLAAGVTRMITSEGKMLAEDWLVDDTGNIAAEADYDESGQRWSLKLNSNGAALKPVDVSAPIEGPRIEGFSEDGSGVILRLPVKEGYPTYEKISLKDGSVGTWEHSGYQFDGLVADHLTGRVIGAPLFSDKSDYVFFEPRADIVWRSVKAAFAGATDVQLVSWSEDRNKVVVLVFGPRYGAGYFLVDMATHKADPIDNLYEGIDEVSPVSWIDYPAADGRLIHAYLTLPVGRDPKSLPLVVLPHGGPFARDEPGFDWLSQAIASRGYAVLQSQFRGSDGFGKDLLWAGFGEFGKKMQTDLSDGVRALAAKGVIDKKRVCIVGASYGGYAALAGATLDTGVYRCAVSDSGISDLHALLAYWHGPFNALDNSSERYWDRFLGIADIADPKLDAISPIRHVDRVTIPILLIHGHDDTVVPFAQSEDMDDALKAAGKDVTFVKLDGEDHWLSRSTTRTQMLEATVKFLEANNPPN